MTISFYSPIAMTILYFWYKQIGITQNSRLFFGSNEKVIILRIFAANFWKIKVSPKVAHALL